MLKEVDREFGNYASCNFKGGVDKTSDANISVWAIELSGVHK